LTVLPTVSIHKLGWMDGCTGEVGLQSVLYAVVRPVLVDCNRYTLRASTGNQCKRSGREWGLKF